MLELRGRVCEWKALIEGLERVVCFVLLCFAVQDFDGLGFVARMLAL